MQDDLFGGQIVIKEATYLTMMGCINEVSVECSKQTENCLSKGILGFVM
jgi:hypothetical protein